MWHDVQELIDSINE